VSVKPEKKHREIFEIFHEIFQAKKFHEILHHYSCVMDSWLCFDALMLWGNVPLYCSFMFVPACVFGK